MIFVLRKSGRTEDGWFFGARVSLPGVSKFMPWINQNKSENIWKDYRFAEWKQLEIWSGKIPGIDLAYLASFFHCLKLVVVTIQLTTFDTNYQQFILVNKKGWSFLKLNKSRHLLLVTCKLKLGFNLTHLYMPSHQLLQRLDDLAPPEVFWRWGAKTSARQISCGYSCENTIMI